MRILAFPVFLCVVSIITGCRAGIRSSYTQALLARIKHPDKRVMQVANETVCLQWPMGAHLSFYCDDELVGELKPREDRAIVVPAQAFTFRVVAQLGGKEIGRKETPYPAATEWAELPSQVFQRTSF